MHQLQTENTMLIGENVMRFNEIKTLKIMHSSKTEEKESHIKELQNKLHQANKIAANKTKELNKPKQDIVPKEQDIICYHEVEKVHLYEIKTIYHLHKMKEIARLIAWQVIWKSLKSL